MRWTVTLRARERRATRCDPVSLAIQRTTEFAHNKEIVMASTPTIKGISRIELAWRESDQRDYFVPCPQCGCFQVLAFGDGTGPGAVWPEGKQKTLRVVAPNAAS